MNSSYTTTTIPAVAWRIVPGTVCLACGSTTWCLVPHWQSTLSLTRQSFNHRHHLSICLAQHESCSFARIQERCVVYTVVFTYNKHFVVWRCSVASGNYLLSSMYQQSVRTAEYIYGTQRINRAISPLLHPTYSLLLSPDHLKCPFPYTITMPTNLDRAIGRGSKVPTHHPWTVF